MEENTIDNKSAQNQPEQKQDQPGKTFTQEEVNRIVSERLARDRDKRAAELDEREKSIKARELALTAAEKLAEAGLPKELSSVLKYDDEESLETAIMQLSSMRGFANGKNNPAAGKRVYLENKLPENMGDIDFHDPFRDAFRPIKE